MMAMHEINSMTAESLIQKLQRLAASMFELGGKVDEMPIRRVNGHYGTKMSGAEGILLSDIADPNLTLMEWSADTGCHMPVHRHSVTEHLYVLEGRLYDRYGKKWYSRGDTVIWEPHQLHEPCFSEGPCRFLLTFTPALRLKIVE